MTLFWGSPPLLAVLGGCCCCCCCCPRESVHCQVTGLLAINLLQENRDRERERWRDPPHGIEWPIQNASLADDDDGLHVYIVFINPPENVDCWTENQETLLLLVVWLVAQTGTDFIIKMYSPLRLYIEELDRYTVESGQRRCVVVGQARRRHLSRES